MTVSVIMDSELWGKYHNTTFHRTYF